MDNTIKNCNHIFWLRNEPGQATRIWNIGKEIFFTFSWEDNIIVNRIDELENKDNRSNQVSGERVETVINEDN